MKINWFVILLLSAGIWTSGRAQFRIDAQYRVRAQLMHGYKKPVPADTIPAFHVGQRTRINFRYRGKGFRTMLSVQDVRIWGDEDMVNPTGVKGKTHNSLDIYEAWIRFDLGTYSSLKIGRQEMKYDDQRHISWRNWWNHGQAYDAVTYSYKRPDIGWQWDISASFNAKAEHLWGVSYSEGTDYFGKVNPILTQNFIYLKKQFRPDAYASLLLIGAGYQNEQAPHVIYMTMTEGIHLHYNMTGKSKDGWFGRANFFIQNGKNIKGQSIRAHMITALAGYRMLDKRLAFNGGLEILSGNDATNTDPAYRKIDHTYNLLYGGRHPYYEGYLDWFVRPESAAGAGIRSLSFTMQYAFSPADMFKFQYFQVAAANNVVKKNRNGTVTLTANKGALLARTFDWMYIRKFNKMTMMHAGFSYGIPSETFQKMKGRTKGGHNYFAYVMLTFKPVLFASGN